VIAARPLTVSSVVELRRVLVQVKTPGKAPRSGRGPARAGFAASAPALTPPEPAKGNGS